MKCQNCNRSEEAIQEEICQFLALEGWEVFVFAPPRSHKRLGGIVPEGWPDLLAISRRLPWPTYLHFEVKRPGGRLSPKQVVMRRALRDLGCRVAVVESAEECAEVLGGWGFEVRTRFRQKEEP